MKEWISKLIILSIVVGVIYYIYHRIKSRATHLISKATPLDVFKRINNPSHMWEDAFKVAGNLMEDDRLLRPIGGTTTVKPVKPQQGGDSKLENVCRAELESLMGCPFPKARPDFLKNPITGRNLEADAWNEDLGLIVEIQGRQHYKFTPFFHKTQDAFRTQQYRDHIKRECCARNGFKLLEVPYTVKPQQARSWLRNKLKELGYNPTN